MENLSHSRQQNVLSKKSCIGSSTAKSIYDDVFGGPPRFGAPTLSPRVEDYREIFDGFHSSRASSIPVLDLPLVDEAAEVFCDVRSSGFDYGEVFGGSNANDFALYYDELLMMEQSNGLGDDSSSDEAWAPAEAENLSDESDHSAKEQCISNGDSYDSIDGDMEFYISYNKVGPRSNENLSNGIAHITQPHSVSGCTFVVDKTSSLPKTDYEYQHLQASNDDHLSIDYSGEVFRGRHLRKVMSYPANGTNNDVLFFGEDVRRHKEFVRNGSLPNEMFVTISNVSLRTQPSHLPPPTRPPPPLDVLRGDSGKATPNCKSVTSEETTGDSSPPYFDVEVDASSSAAASAAAIKEAMEKAQAKLKSAKESMERKRGGVQNHLKSGSKNDRKDKEEMLTKIVNGSVSRNDEREQGISQIEENGKEFSILEEKKKVKRTTQPISDSLEGKKHLDVAKKTAEENHGRESSSSQVSERIDGASEWKEATQFFELVTNKSRKAFDQENTENDLLHNSNFHERAKKGKGETVEALQQLERNHKKVKAVRADDEPVDRRSSGRSEVVNRQKGIDKKLQVAREASRQEGDEKKFHMDWKPVETEKRQAGADDFQKHENYVEVQQKESKIAARQTMKHREKGLRLKEDSRSMEDVKKFTHEKGDSERRQRKVFELEENERKLNVPLEQAENDRRLKKAVHKQEENENILREAYEREENERRLREALRREENERRLKEALEKKENERILKETGEKEERLRRQREAVERQENENRLIEVRERKENEKRQREAREREENEKRQRDAREREENEKRQRDAREREENEKRKREAREREENEKRQREAREREENEKRKREARVREENEKRLKEALEKEENERRMKEIVEVEERQRRRREVIEREENAKREREENEKKLKEAEKEQNERRLKAAVEHEENEKRQREVHEKEENEKSEPREKEGSEKRCKETFEREEIELEALEREVGKRLEELCEQQDKCMASRRAQEAEVSEVALKEDHKPEENRTSSQDTCEWEETEAKHIDVGESGKQKALNKMGKDHSVLNQACELGNDKSLGATQLPGKNEGNSEKLELTKEFANEETSKIMNELRNGEKEVASGIALGNLEDEKSQFLMEDSTDTEQKNIRSTFRVDLGIGNQGKKFPYEKSEKGKNIEQTQVSLNPEISNASFMSAKTVKESVDSARKMGGAQPAVFEVKESIQRTAQRVNTTQSTERKVKNSHETVSSEDKEAERMKRERELEMERLRKLEEEREREREREKDRMAVDKAALDTRERAYAEARERAERAAVERATAEARQRALNEARERLEKACAEAREKSLTDKASMEARLRAERAAVEKATAEARERAFEKAMAERAAFEARERVERSVSDKFSTSSRSGGMKESSSSSDLQDLQSQGSGSFSGSRYQYSSVYGERFEGVEGESALRYKARLERHQRTAERAAKALAEKNMRDLFAQREQAERNRLAETLDADVKRWSSGKEGNLRALLSTLQYILGPDSGWQSIPLTEVITAAAVKKAYRKATLCVHPDKLQQRGASIQQKYICEKVFDLLKEAWNKFNSEER